MSKERYDHQYVEAKWQRKWKDSGVFKATVDYSRPKYYVLDMFPYPSGDGLHVGHITGYTGTDILARYKRQKGFNVLHPMGWDSFGLPAERHAIRTGQHPAKTTEKNISTFRRQLQAVGFSYDWDREFATSDPKHYKWTQWIFTKLYEKGLAYEAEELVNYCPATRSVLANEEVENGRSVETGDPVERRPLRQWKLKITAYAEKLLEGLDDLDWPEDIVRLQKNWIGRSEGALIYFSEQTTGEKIPVFTTRHDTIFGITFLVLSPEHPIVNKITTPGQRPAVNAYKKLCSAKSDRERSDLKKEKTGVWTGGYVNCPVSGGMIPVWIGDYVLLGYGTGAVMGVPSSDDRDFEFAKKYSISIKPVVDPLIDPNVPEQKELRQKVLAGEASHEGNGTLINSNSIDLRLDGLTIEEGKAAVAKWLEEKGQGKGTVSYKLRDWLFSRQRYWGEPIPILSYQDGTKRALDLDELPLTPPVVHDYEPAESGESPLVKVKEWINITDPRTGKRAIRETNTMPQWAGSCWYYLRFCDPSNDEMAWSPELEKYWMPVDMYVGGKEHATLHLLYARFWHKVLYDLKLVSTPEPFNVLKNQGLVIAKAYKIPGGSYVAPEEVIEKDGKFYQAGTEALVECELGKMGKSKLNGVNPDEVIEEYGADCLRLYAMFMAPFEKEKVWITDAVIGCHRFLARYYDVATSEKICEEETPEGMKLAHILVDGVERDLQQMQFNTAIAKMMEFMNQFQPLSKYPKKAIEMLTQCLYPLAPHITEEVWEMLGYREGLSFVPFPVADPKYLVKESVNYAFQINGKMRGSFEMPIDITEESLIAFAREEKSLGKYIQGEIRKVIFVKGRLLNIVCG